MGCTSKKSGSAQPGEGTVVYEITYPDSTKFKAKSVFFPRTITLIFKGNKAAFIANAGLGMVQVVNLMDYDKQTYTSLLISGIGQNFACKLTPDEIKNNETAEKLDFEITKESKIIAGLNCTKAIVKNKTTNSISDLYYYDKIKFNYWNSPFKDFQYLFTEYTHTINHLTLKLKAVDIDLKTPVDEKMFEVKGQYQWVNEKEFYATLDRL